MNTKCWMKCLDCNHVDLYITESQFYKKRYK